MILAISSTGNRLHSTVDERFARCPWFFIYNGKTEAYGFYPNNLNEKLEGVGQQVVQFMIENKVQLVVSGNFGQKIKQELDKASIGLVIFENKNITMEEVLHFFQLNPKHKL